MSQPAGGVAPCSTRVMNLAHFVTQARRREPEAIALVWGDRTWTWTELDARIDAAAAALQSRFGVGKGDRILVQSQNCNQMFEAMFACIRIGAVYVPTNHLYLGDVIICHRDKASFPDITVEQGIRIFLTGGMALSGRMKARVEADRV